MSNMVPADHFMGTIAVNVDNEKLSDADFREFIRNTLPIVEYSRKMNAYTKEVLSRLIPIVPDEMPYVVRAIEDCEKKGWTIEEAASKVRWLEHVDPTIPEDVALRAMRAVDERVALRQKM